MKNRNETPDVDPYLREIMGRLDTHVRLRDRFCMWLMRILARIMWK